ncbi:MAG: polyprenyl synthetase family protein [Nitrospirae bacterium]|nr:polyprenyl synthetase family protein [Nitrospirota bacterium]
MTIDDIYKQYQNDILSAEEKINETFSAVAPAISMVGKHILVGGGKRIRPFLAILSSKLSGYDGEKVSTLACCIESLHTASLLHDDVVDGANMRRGRPSAHYLWGNQVVILVGDFLYANALRLINFLQNQSIMDAMTSATASMSESELLQLSRKGDPNITEEDYIKIVKGKTAVLMSAACRGGALLGGVSQEKEDALASFGLKLGFAFQIADDILDYMAEEKNLGKTLGKDMEEGKITLPLIYLLKDASKNEVERIQEIIKAEEMAISDLSYILELLKKYKSIEKSYEKARTFLKEAQRELEIFGNSMEKNALLTISNYVLSREK